MEQRDNNLGGITGKGWFPGESGNPEGRPKNSVTTLLKNRSPKDNQRIADKLYQLALDGDMSAIREYIDRTDGKVSDILKVEGQILITPDMRAIAMRELLEVKEEESKLLKEGLTNESNTREEETVSTRVHEEEEGSNRDGV